MNTSSATQENSTLSTLARVLSVILHPVLMPVYLMGILLGEGLLLPYATAQAKVYFSGVILLNTVVVPAICMLLFSRIRFWREGPNTDFRDRVLPAVVMIICYSACLVMVRHVPFALTIKKMLTAGICCVTLGLIVSFFWRISLHMTAQGAVVAFIGIMIASGARGLLPMLCVSIALTAMLASARLMLGKHDAAQAGAGFLGGFVVTLVSVYLPYLINLATH